MSVIRILFYVVIISILFACASSNKQVKYYSLTLNNDHHSLLTTANNSANIEQPRVVVGPIHLAKFLRQGGLVVQIGEHEVNTANYHRWAEPLEEAIAKLLVQELNSRSDTYQFARRVGQWNQNATLHLGLEFDKFHATDKAKTVTSGRYWFYEKNNILKMNQTFYVSESLTHDGYLHAVEKLEQGIGRLSDQIIASLDHVEEY